MNDQSQPIESGGVNLVSAALVAAQGNYPKCKKLVNFLLPLRRTSTTELEYFINRTYSMNTECWLWRGGLDHSGYGTTKGRHPKAHRLAWELFKGPIPAGLMVLHRCDVRCCVNPDHLFLGTQTDNMRDMIAKGRGRPSGVVGSKHGNAKLTEEKVLEMRALRSQRNIPYNRLGAMFGIGHGQAHGICTRRAWRHV